MSIGLYDEALYNKINKWVKGPNMRILKTDETTRLFQMIADQNNDKPIKLPVIAISRDKSIRILEPHKQVKSFDGYHLIESEYVTDSDGRRYKKEQPCQVPVNVLPIEIKYQLDIYTRGRDEGDEYVRNFVFNFINSPKLVVDVPYNDLGFKHISNLYLDENIQDNSDINEHLFSDQFVRYTLTIYVDDAYLFSLPVKDTVSIVLDDGSGGEHPEPGYTDYVVVVDKNTLN